MCTKIYHDKADIDPKKSRAPKNPQQRNIKSIGKIIKKTV